MKVIATLEFEDDTTPAALAASGITETQLKRVYQNAFLALLAAIETEGTRSRVAQIKIENNTEE